MTPSDETGFLLHAFLNRTTLFYCLFYECVYILNGSVIYKI